MIVELNQQSSKTIHINIYKHSMMNVLFSKYYLEMRVVCII